MPDFPPSERRLVLLNLLDLLVFLVLLPPILEVMGVAPTKRKMEAAVVIFMLDVGVNNESGAQGVMGWILSTTGTRFARPLLWRTRGKMILSKILEKS